LPITAMDQTQAELATLLVATPIHMNHLAHLNREKKLPFGSVHRTEINF